jgi:hypothetical protein
MRNIKWIRIVVGLIILLCGGIATYIFKTETLPEKVVEEFDLATIEKYEFLIPEEFFYSEYRNSEYESLGKKNVTITAKDDIKKINEFLGSLIITTRQPTKSMYRTANIPAGTVNIYFSDNRSLYFEIDQSNYEQSILYFAGPLNFTKFENKNSDDLFRLVLECDN